MIPLNTTLRSLSYRRVSPEHKTTFLQRLIAVPTLQSVEADGLEGDDYIKLLQSRTNWTRITLPPNGHGSDKVAALAALNRTSFHLEISGRAASADDVKKAMANPCLTSLKALELPAGCYEALKQSPNLTNLVLPPFVLSLSFSNQGV